MEMDNLRGLNLEVQEFMVCCKVISSLLPQYNAIVHKHLCNHQSSYKKMCMKKLKSQLGNLVKFLTA